MNIQRLRAPELARSGDDRDRSARSPTVSKLERECWLPRCSRSVASPRHRRRRRDYPPYDKTTYRRHAKQRPRGYGWAEAGRQPRTGPVAGDGATGRMDTYHLYLLTARSDLAPGKRSTPTTASCGYRCYPPDAMHLRLVATRVRPGRDCRCVPYNYFAKMIRDLHNAYLFGSPLAAASFFSPPSSTSERERYLNPS